MTQFNISTLDLPSLHRSAIGFDRMFGELNRTLASSKAGNYPPHNIVQLNETQFVIEVAVAGFAENEIDVELAHNVLTVTGTKTGKASQVNPKYLHQGISNRDFVRDFTLADNVEVRGAAVENGILSVSLELVIPETQKPKRIDIFFKK